MPETDRETLASRIRRLRAARAWPQEQLADAACLSLRTVQRVENGHACAPETVQALAAAFDIDAATLSDLLPAQRLRRSRWFGLSARAAPWVGLVLCLPAAVFIVANVAYYEFGWTSIEPLLKQLFWSSGLDNPFVLLGGPALAVMLNAPHLFALRARSTNDGELIEGVLVSWSLMRFAVVVLALGVIAVLLTYAVSENLIHLIRDVAGAPAGRADMLHIIAL